MSRLKDHKFMRWKKKTTQRELEKLWKWVNCFLAHDPLTFLILPKFTLVLLVLLVRQLSHWICKEIARCSNLFKTTERII